MFAPRETAHVSWRVAGAFVVLMAVASCSASSDGATSSQPAVEGGAIDSAPAPWPAPTDVRSRVERAGLGLGPMGMAEHYHPRLRIVVNGHPVAVAGGVGVDPATGAMSAVHTHDPDGTIHVEAATAGEKFTLGQFFVQWGVRLTATQIGEVRAEPGQKTSMTVNGAQVGGDPARLRLRPDQSIVLRIG